MKLETVQIIDIFGNVLEELLLYNKTEGFYVNKSFHPPTVPFQISVSEITMVYIITTASAPLAEIHVFRVDYRSTIATAYILFYLLIIYFDHVT